MQRSMCAVCFRKQKILRSISAKVKMEIKEYVFANFDTEDWDWLPTKICSGCYKGLYDIAKNPR